MFGALFTDEGAHDKELRDGRRKRGERSKLAGDARKKTSDARALRVNQSIFRRARRGVGIARDEMAGDARVLRRACRTD
jgi:hypothetical protein